MDLSVNMISIALERASGRKNALVTFEIADCTTRDYGEESFDVVYSRDTILHVQVRLHVYPHTPPPLRVTGDTAPIQCSVIAAREGQTLLVGGDKSVQHCGVLRHVVCRYGEAA